ARNSSPLIFVEIKLQNSTHSLHSLQKSNIFVLQPLAIPASSSSFPKARVKAVAAEGLRRRTTVGFLLHGTFQADESFGWIPAFTRGFKGSNQSLFSGTAFALTNPRLEMERATSMEMCAQKTIIGTTRKGKFTCYA
ncbi:MAG TPA: hypothetical protein VF766_05020, partial [Pyrinomonadaceae bacterium]